MFPNTCSPREIPIRSAERKEQERAPAKEKQRAKLDQWTYNGTTLHGIVYDHPKLPDGEEVSTSAVWWININAKIAETQNTVYILLKHK